jgi:hypothetical protein
MEEPMVDAHHSVKAISDGLAPGFPSEAPPIRRGETI